MAASDRFRPRDIDLSGKALPPIERAAWAAPARLRSATATVSAGFGQAPRDGFPDPGGGSGHKSRLSGKLESHLLLFFDYVDRDLGGDVAVQPHRDLVLAELLDGLVELDLAAVDGEVLLLERLGDVLGGDRTEELIVLAGLLGDGDGDAAQILARSSASPFSLASRRRCAWRSCSTIFLLASVAGTASRLGSR